MSISTRTVLRRLGFILVAAVPCTALALTWTSNRGEWSSDWPKELEQYREQAHTYQDCTPAGSRKGEVVYTIPFKERKRFEQLWPTLLKLKSPGEPLKLQSGGVSASPDSRKPSVLPGVKIYAPEESMFPKSSPRSRPKPGGRSTIELVLYVDGKVINLNRIRFPADTPIVDKRALESEK